MIEEFALRVEEFEAAQRAASTGPVADATEATEATEAVPVPSATVEDALETSERCLGHGMVECPVK